MAQTQ
jgi:hypothetical protein